MWFEKRVEHWIRFGRIADEAILDRRRRRVAFAYGVFAFVRWAANDVSTTIWQGLGTMNGGEPIAGP